MKTQEHKEKADKHEVRSVEEFKRKFYPKPIKPDNSEFPEAEKVGEEVADELIHRLQAALSAK